MPTRNIFIIAACLIVSSVCYSEFHKNRYSDTIAEAMTIIEEQALKKLSRRELFRAAMKGMVAQIDEHSAFFDGKESTQMQESLDQEFGGIGIIVEGNTETGLTVVTPLPNTPAAEAGMLPGDVITAVNNNPTSEMTRNEAISMIKGPVGQTVNLQFIHRGESEIQTADIQRAIVEEASVEGDYRDESLNWTFQLEENPQIGYIRLSTFGKKSDAEMSEALSAINGKVSSLILDLRDNPGGLLDIATKLADKFIDGGLIVETRRRDGDVELSVMATDTLEFDKTIPMVVMINGRSASASEILSACLKDHNRATICGARSWGKGTVQNVIPMENQKSTLKITTASYWRPSGKNIHRAEGAEEEDEWGVSPDAGFALPLTTEQEIEVMRYRNLRDRKNIGGNVDAELKNVDDPQLRIAIDYLESLSK